MNQTKKGRQRNKTGASAVNGGTMIAPLAMATSGQLGEPRSRSGPGYEVIEHREYIGNLVAPENGANFAISVYETNPGSSETFPWLSQQAERYEQYTVEFMQFHILTRQATTNAGSVIVAPEYNVETTVPTDEATLTAYKGACEDVIWRDIVVTVNTKDFHNTGSRKFVRISGAPTQLTDGAYMYVATTGLTTAEGSPLLQGTEIAKIWVSYRIRFFVPQINVTASSVNYATAEDDEAPLYYYGEQILSFAIAAAALAIKTWITWEFGPVAEDTKELEVDVRDLPKIADKREPNVRYIRKGARRLAKKHPSPKFGVPVHPSAGLAAPEEARYFQLSSGSYVVTNFTNFQINITAITYNPVLQINFARYRRQGNGTFQNVERLDMWRHGGHGISTGGSVPHMYFLPCNMHTVVNVTPQMVKANENWFCYGVQMADYDDQTDTLLDLTSGWLLYVSKAGSLLTGPGYTALDVQRIG